MENTIQSRYETSKFQEKTFDKKMADMDFFLQMESILQS